MDRESVVFLIDASPAMLRRAPGATTHAVDGARPDSSSNAATGRGGAGSAVTTYLDVALDCARGMLRDRVVSAPSDKQGVVFFNTTRTRGLDDHLDGLSARENVYVYHRAAPPSARRPRSRSRCWPASSSGSGARASSTSIGGTGACLRSSRCSSR